MERKFIGKLHRNDKDIFVLIEDKKYKKLVNFDSLQSLLNLKMDLLNKLIEGLPWTNIDFDLCELLPLLDQQFVIATGVTFNWSNEKIEQTPSSDIYKKLYESQRPMFFMKGNAKSTLPKGEIGIRKDSNRTIPEAEFVAVINKHGEIVGYTIGNDQTAIDIEKDNPLYQMQAKFYRGSFELLPIVLFEPSLPKSNLRLEVIRQGKNIVQMEYSTEEFNRDVNVIAKNLMESKVYNDGVFLFLGCGVTFSENESLLADDKIIISSNCFPINLEQKCVVI